jgi:hypothetical protein
MAAAVAYGLPQLQHVRSSLAASLETATAAVVRLDERIARLGRVGEGYCARAEFQEACALRALAGDLIRLEDLALAVAGALVRLSTIELIRARNILAARRAAAGKPATWAASDEALFDDRLDVERDELLYQLGEEDWDEGERVDQWRAVVDGLKNLPTMLNPAIAWDAWLRIEPLHGNAWRSTLLAASLLRAGGLTQHHLLAIGIGGRRSRYRDDGRLPFEQRILGFLDWVRLAAETGQKELQRLSLAEKVLRQVARHDHADSRLPALIDLVLTRPLISSEIAK